MSETFGTRVKVLRKKAGLTQFQLAEKLNIHERTISKWERDLSEPDFGVYGLLAEALGVSLEELFGLSASNGRIEGKFNVLSFGKTISTERKRLNESQLKLADIVGTSANTVSKWERGVICPDKHTFLKLAEHFGLQPSAFYYSVSLQKDASVATENLPVNKKRFAVLAVSAVIIIAVIMLLIGIFTSGNAADDFDIPQIPDASTPQTPDVPATPCEHNYIYRTIEASCISQGYTEHTCTECGDSYKSDYTPKTQHIMGAWTIDIKATCTQFGSSHCECAVCYAVIQTMQTEKSAHNYLEEYVPPAADGYGYKLFVCIDCNYAYKDEFTLPVESELLYEFDSEAKTCTVKGVGENAEGFIEIPSYVAGFKVISISSRAFEDCVTLREIVIPDTVIEIGTYAFHRCTLLKQVVLPDSVLELGDEAFCGCRSLKSAQISAKLTRLKYSVFSDCVNLTSIDIPSGITVIEDLAFHNCQKLDGIILPENLTYIGLYAFYDCRSLTNINIPETVDYIGWYAFQGCTELSAADFGNPDGWMAGDTVIDSADLSDSAICSNYLTDIYCTENWERKK